MNTCKTCTHMIPSRDILNQGACNKIVHIGTIQKYKEAKISFAKGQIAGLVDNELNAWLIMDIESFGCNLYEESDKKEPNYVKPNKSNKSEKIPANDLLESETPEPIKDNK